jgi:hypothetical protein
MLYANKGKNFKEHVHPNLQKRLRIFMVMGIIMLLVAGYDVVQGTVLPTTAFLALCVGGTVGWFTSRIFHLSWSEDGRRVVGRIDTIGWFVLAAYILFEIARAVLFETVIHTTIATTTAITFAIISSALLSRVLGLRGRIVDILQKEKVFA